MREELSQVQIIISENSWEAQVLENYLNDGDETNFLKFMAEISQGEIPLWMAENLLTMSAQHNLKLAVTAILKRFEGKYLNVREAARTAVQNGHYDIFEALLKVKPEIAHYLILSICLMLGEPRKRVDDIRSNLEKCLKLILNQVKDVRCTDKKGNTLLNYAARVDNRKAMNLLLKRGSYIGRIIAMLVAVSCRHFISLIGLLRRLLEEDKKSNERRRN
ncbi:Transient receptor potential cation channel protein painless [Temnothorax longispinosus]|uniref:Transient receptor potential cation channel protein painless n=1 Tax=Temnothorax longispinosus TaxID=300112 RepID=A0A4S2JQ58_9HYME|nr:Transient receptor potential cation channel protein painless [Temnothorax longispinosus]